MKSVPTRRLTVCGRVLFSAFLVLAPAWASWAHEFNVDDDGFVIHGMDAVEYVDRGHAISGESEFVGEFKGAKFRFASAENLATFTADPKRYVPAYGGWCAYGVRVGKKFDVDPKVFKVVDGRLFLQLDQGTQKIWIGDLSKNIAIADRLWPRLKDISPKLLDE